MKKLIAIALSLFSLTVTAAPELTPVQKLFLANAATALVVGPVVLPVAIAAGRAEGLCNVMGGTYTPNSDGKDQCPGGAWLRIIPYIKG